MTPRKTWYPASRIGTSWFYVLSQRHTQGTSRLRDLVWIPSPSCLRRQKSSLARESSRRHVSAISSDTDMHDIGVISASPEAPLSISRDLVSAG